MNRYYIVFEKIYKKHSVKSWCIMDTYQHLNLSEDLEEFINELINRYSCGIWLINWKRLDN